MATLRERLFAWSKAAIAFSSRRILPLSIVGSVLAVHFCLQGVAASSGAYTIPAGEMKKLGLPEQDLSLLDNRTVESVGLQLAALPGVKKVNYVRRLFPRTLRVSLLRRVPWAVVFMGDSFYAVDDMGIRVGGTFKRPPKTPSGLALWGVLASPPPAGRPWEGEDFRAALEMARLVVRTPILRRLVTTVDVSNFSHRISAGESEVVMGTRSGCRILWGNVSADPALGEPDVALRLEHLRRIDARFPGLQGLEYARVYVRNFPTVKRASCARRDDGNGKTG